MCVCVCVCVLHSDSCRQSGSTLQTEEGTDRLGARNMQPWICLTGSYIMKIGPKQIVTGKTKLTLHLKQTGPGPEVIIFIFMLNSIEHEFFPAHKC